MAAFGIGKATGNQALCDVAAEQLSVDQIKNVDAFLVLANGRSGSKINRAQFRLEREAFWKLEAQANPTKYSEADLARMQQGRAPIGPDGKPMELHHRDGTPDGPLDPLSRTEHRGGENYRKNHPWLGD
jgi:hypothetical protein